MGRKFKLSAKRKYEEENRQAKKINKVGRPRKVRWTQLTQPTSIDKLISSVSLPPSWICQHPSTLCKIEVSQNEGCEISKSITLLDDYTWKVFVHSHEISHSNLVLKDIARIITTSACLQLLVNALDTATICCGNCEQQFVSLVEDRNGSILNNGATSAYLDKTLPLPVGGHSTVRASGCEIICISENSVCTRCYGYRRNLRALASRSRRVSSSVKQKRLNTGSHTNYRYLKSPELRERLHNSMGEVRALSRRVAKLKEKLHNLTQSMGVDVDEMLHSDLNKIMSDNNISSEHPPDSFAHIFWEQQQESMRKHPNRMRWHPMMIKWCIHLRMLSASCYNSLRSSGAVKLPSERTLRDYTHVIKASSGFQGEVDAQLQKEANITSEHEKYVALVFDEVKVKEDLVYNKNTGELIGFVNLSDINQHLLALEQACDDDDHDTALPPQLATHMLVFMVRGICSSLKFPYAQFPVRAASGEVMHPIVWECVEHIESTGLKVVAFVSDGASCNRKFYSMQGKGTSFTHKTKNVYAEDDHFIFLVSDVPHLLKTARNSWANSHAHSNTRHLRNNGEDISWQHLIKLYERHCTMHHTAPGLTILPKLKHEHIHLTSYSKMRVDLAAQVLSKSVADAFSLEEHRTETERFVRNMDRFFDCMNARNFDEAILKRKPDLRPYRSTADPRLTWLENEFLQYFSEWESSVKMVCKEKYERERLRRVELAKKKAESETEKHDQEVELMKEESEKHNEDNVEMQPEAEIEVVKEKDNRKISEKEREKKEKEKMRREIDKCQIAKETRRGINFTVKAIVELIRYCLSIPDVKCILTGHLNQDPLEAFFGRQRMSCGRNDNPSVNMFLNNTVSIRVQKSAALLPFRGNCMRKKRSELKPISVDNTPLEKRRRNSK